MQQRFWALRTCLGFLAFSGISFACNPEGEPPGGSSRGIVLYRTQQSPCGTTLFESGDRAGKVAYTFTGYETEKALDVLDAGARMYQSRLCRFSSPDPVIQPGESSYTYASNSFLNHVDPDGRQSAVVFPKSTIWYIKAWKAAKSYAVRNRVGEIRDRQERMYSGSFSNAIFIYYNEVFLEWGMWPWNWIPSRESLSETATLGRQVISLDPDAVGIAVVAISEAVLLERGKISIKNLATKHGMLKIVDYGGKSKRIGVLRLSPEGSELHIGGRDEVAAALEIPGASGRHPDLLAQNWPRGHEDRVLRLDISDDDRVHLEPLFESPPSQFPKISNFGSVALEHGLDLVEEAGIQGNPAIGTPMPHLPASQTVIRRK